MNIKVTDPTTKEKQERFSPKVEIILDASPNPYQRGDFWYFHDETDDEYGPYSSQQKALHELLRYCHWLDHGPTIWQRVWWAVKGWFKS